MRPFSGDVYSDPSPNKRERRDYSRDKKHDLLVKRFPYLRDGEWWHVERTRP